MHKKEKLIKSKRIQKKWTLNEPSFESELFWLKGKIVGFNALKLIINIFLNIKLNWKVWDLLSFWLLKI